MSFLVTEPDLITAATTDLANINLAVRSTSFAVSAATTRLASAGVDQVSDALAVMFGNHGLDYQNVAAAAAGFHDRFVQGLAVGANG